MERENENLISIDEVIFRAKKLGVDFGRGNPRERLRYLTKLGLLPNAKRKSLNGQPPSGVYPEYVIELLKEIDEKIKTGKSIQQIKKEKERKGLAEAPYTSIHPPVLEIPRPKIEIQPKEKKIEIKRFAFPKITNVLKIVLLVLLSGEIIFVLSNQTIMKDFYFSHLLASFNWLQKLVQAPPAPIEEMAEKKEILLPSSPEPYLTINAETDINAPLNVKETITVPALTFTKAGFKGTLTTADLTADRSYIFPNLSGTVCLTTGNCVGIGGEVLSPAGGAPNRLAKFVSAREIGISSISDFYLRGVALTIDALGNVGIGTARPRGKLDVAGELITTGNIGIGIEDPAYPLHVRGRIQATGDICTDIGGKCLSQLATAPTFFGRAPFSGISGSGSVNYLPIWTTRTSLGNSIISQNGSILTIAGSGYFQGPLTIDSSSLPQLVLKYDDNNYLKFSLTSTSSEILASKTMVFNSLTGEIKFWDTSIKKGEYILRSSLPIFKFPIAAQTTSTEFVAVTKEISTSTLNAALPQAFPGSQRKMAFLLNFADDIATSASSTWLIDLAPPGTDTEFTFAGQNFSDLSEGVSHLSGFYSPPEQNWQLKVKVPLGNTIRIFNIFLLVFDQVN